MRSTYRKGLTLAIVACVLALAACKKPENGPGLDLLPGSDALTAFQTDTVSIQVTTEREDSLRTDELSTCMLGSYIDPVFGVVQASFATQLRLSTTSASFPAQLEIDSVVLALVYDDKYYGRLLPQTFSVAELSGDLFIDSTYYSNRRPDYLAGELVEPWSATQQIRPSDYVPFGEDSLVPQLRLHLTKEFGSRLVQPADPSVLGSTESFREYLKGIVVQTLPYDAAVVNYDLVDPASKITVYYRDQSEAEEDTTSYDFLITSDCARYTYLQHQYGGTELAGLLTGPVDGSQRCYVQAGAGTKTRIDLPFIQDLNQVESRTVNGAELLIPFEDDPRLRAQSQLFLLYRNGEGNLTVLPDQVSQNIGGLADFGDNVYRFRITRYIQQLLNGEITSQGLYLVSNEGGVSVNRVVCHGPDHLPGQPGANMRLVLTVSH